MKRTRAQAPFFELFPVEDHVAFSVERGGMFLI
jgi:hypothetical protein